MTSSVPFQLFKSGEPSAFITDETLHQVVKRPQTAPIIITFMLI
jgi:hypothetical protein